MKKAYIIIGALLLPAAAVAGSNQSVSVASLEVKERIRSIEQINVTAATEQADISPASKAVTDLLRELDRLDAADAQAADEKPQSD